MSRLEEREQESEKKKRESKMSNKTPTKKPKRGKSKKQVVRTPDSLAESDFDEN